MSSNATFYTEEDASLSEFREGIVYYWPTRQQDQGKPPIRGRLMRIHSPRHKVDVWLFTNVLDPKQLPWRRRDCSIVGDGKTKDSSGPTSGR